MTEPANLPAARDNAKRTYDRRRARAAAETLANLGPECWDAATKAILLTLATLAAPSRIDNVLAMAFPAPPDVAETRINDCAHLCGPPGPLLRGEVDHVRGCAYRGCHPATTLECGVCGYVAPLVHDNGDYRA